jgi:RimJ/RimL family protein N-acetyltransferase
MELLTARLRLRPPAPTDGPRALILMRDPEVLRWNPTRAADSLSDAEEWIRSGADWADGSHATWHAEDRETGLFVANVSLFAIDPEHQTAKIGYRVLPDFRGRGVGREGLAAVTQWAFAERGIVRIQLEHAIANPGSCRVAEAAGYLLEGTLRSSYAVDGRRYDEHVHGRLADDPAPDV